MLPAAHHATRGVPCAACESPICESVRSGSHTLRRGNVVVRGGFRAAESARERHGSCIRKCTFSVPKG